ncbi:hypothetical protein RB12802 [Rhodopirellula baltica SH 1]|uniref:Uncharacterized protein n=1 Tax=Rhodopirellula baltica (strain DSM 10527 / NCIMB 13988 / SH1) TaxID=243090 RepID=Q7UI27_RHOBA|nr:hypothetical protein RB12802 [Rhodopirellula baltica SH 1]
MVLQRVPLCPSCVHIGGQRATGCWWSRDILRWVFGGMGFPRPVRGAFRRQNRSRPAGLRDRPDSFRLICVSKRCVSGHL